jgi:hypothetical protein
MTPTTEAEAILAGHNMIRCVVYDSSERSIGIWSMYQVVKDFKSCLDYLASSRLACRRYMNTNVMALYKQGVISRDEVRAEMARTRFYIATDVPEFHSDVFVMIERIAE